MSCSLIVSFFVQSAHTKNKKFLLHSQVPFEQCASRSNKQNLTKFAHEKALKDKKKIVDELPSVLWAY